MTDTLNKGDELALFALTDAFNRHVFVFTKNKPWTTVEGGVDLSMSDLRLIHDIHVIYLGNNNYGEIKMREYPTIIIPIMPEIGIQVQIHLLLMWKKEKATQHPQINQYSWNWGNQHKKPS